MNFKMLLAYDGTHYLGWQKTKEGPSIEEALEQALKKILQEKVQLQAASRTDRGVHAAAQVANFNTFQQPDNFQHRLNCLLPKDIRVNSLLAVPESFHPTLDCTGKEYHYWLCQETQLPHYRHYSWNIPSLDILSMQTAADSFIGKHDFKALTNAKKNEEYADTIREIQSIEIVKHPKERLQIKITGNHFLYKMVRNIVGTLVYVGLGKLQPSFISTLLKSGQRPEAGMTAPALGLTLFKVFY